MVLLMQGFFIISCEILVFPADNVRTSAGEITAWCVVHIKPYETVCMIILNREDYWKPPRSSVPGQTTGFSKNQANHRIIQII